jgi:1-acyl-sn-glycerol-3-phosphate acyltransferase
VSPLGRALVVAAYTLVFWVLLPGLLWAAAGWLDPRLPLDWRPMAWGLGLLLPGSAWLLWGIAALWRGGGGLPVSALPPPRLARRGPYAWTRHPIYLGFHVALFGAGLLLGSPGMTLVLAPAFGLIGWAYATWEEAGLIRRFGEDYRRYQRRVGLLPRVPLYQLGQLLVRAGLLPVSVEGAERIPRRGACVLVVNHASYIDAGFVSAATWREVHYTATAEAYRSGLLGWVMRQLDNVPVRRYRPDPRAMREVLGRLSEGQIVGIFPEGERSPLGRYQGTMEDVAGILARLPVPVLPVGLSGLEQVGPRWSDALRRRPVRLRVGEPIDFSEGEPAERIDAALSALIDPPKALDLEGLDLRKLERVLWACPRCGHEPWSPATRSCPSCGPVDLERPLPELAEAQWSSPPEPMVVEVEAWEESSIHGPPRPLQPRGEGPLRLGPEGLDFGQWAWPIACLRSVSTERADTLQIATSAGMWQFRLQRGSVFRLHRALESWLSPGDAGGDPSPPPADGPRSRG